MIVISGALVLVALVLLILGITLPGLSYVYASIVVSLVSGVFLAIGIILRRGDRSDAPGQAQQAPDEQQPASVPVAAGARRGGSVAIVDEPAPATASLPAAPAGAGADAGPAADADADAYDDAYDDEYDDEDIDPADDRAVLVVAGRPRYHAQGCRYLTGKQAEAIHLLDARDEGFTPCGVCKPDNVVALEDDIAVVPAEEGVEPVVDLYDPAVEGADDGVGEQELAQPEPASIQADDPEPAAEPEPVAAASARGRRARGSSAVLQEPSPAATAAAGASSSGRRAGSVVVIPDRGKFHRAECRYVRGVAGAETRTKTQATKQGFTACGVCKP